MMEEKKKIGFKRVLQIVKDVLLWMLVVFCLMAALSFMPSFGAFLFVLVGIASMPLKVVRKLWNYLPKKLRFLKPLVLTILFFVAMFTVPTQQTEPSGTQTEQSIEAEAPGSLTASSSEDVADDLADGLAASTEESAAEGLEVSGEAQEEVAVLSPEETAKRIEDILAAGFPEYTGSVYVVINDNEPYFTAEELSLDSYEYYFALDELGRCGVCVASIGTDIMPTEDRGEISSVKPTGWIQAKYTGVVEGGYLYNRAHLIGFQLTGENANECNLITGTRYLNNEGMLPFENMIADYVKETGNHVMYRVSPVFEGDNLLAKGVLMEAKSVEDDGEGISFCVFCYNVQPGVVIDYTDGSSQEEAQAELEDETEEETETEESGENAEEESEEESEEEEESSEEIVYHYAVNAKNGKIHIIGGCYATGDGDNAMTDPVCFVTYEEALEYSQKNYPKQEKRDCGNCW